MTVMSRYQLPTGVKKIYRTGEVRHGYWARTTRQLKSKRHLSYVKSVSKVSQSVSQSVSSKLKARVTSLVARSAASRMLGYTCELALPHTHTITHTTLC